MRRHGRKGIMVLAAAVLAATLSGCGKKYEEAAVTTASLSIWNRPTILRRLLSLMPFFWE